MSIQIKRICSLVMALIMVCGLIPATAFEAAAVEATTPTVEEISNTAVSTNVEDAICPCGCGRKVTEIPEDEWQEWVFNTRLETGHYRLTESKTGVTRTLISETGKVLLNLNGYDITTGSGYRGITIYTGGVATLIGEGTISGYASGAGIIEIGAGSTFNLYQAEIKNLNTDSTKKVAGTAVTLTNGTSASARTQFNMYSGALVGGKLYSTGSVRVGTYCTFNMYGGTLTAGASSSLNGNGVYMTASSSEFNLVGGDLVGTGKANRGGAVYMANGTFNMSSGKITGFGAGRGAGVFVAAGTFNMTGGEISGNTATSTGSAVDVFGTSAVFNMSGGTVTSDVTAGVGTIHSLSPNVHISGGVVNGNICSTESITVSGAVKIADVDLVTADKDGKAVATSLIVGEAGLKDGSSIGITANDGQQVFAEDTDANVAQYLHSTAAGRNEFVYDNGTLTLIENNYCPVCKQNVTWAEWTNGLTVGGHYYLNNDVTVGSQWTVGQNADPAEYCLDLNGHSFNKGGRAFNIYGGSTANVFSTGFNSQVIGAYVADNAGVINLADNSNMNLYDGLTLIGNAADNGFAGNSGGVIQVNSGTFNMYGSTIIGQKAENGGAVIVNATGTFNMYGGLIKDGIAGHGGNIAVNGGTANISGGIIEGGYTDGDTYGGGNIYVQNSGNVTISGNAVIRDGYSKAKSSDIYRGGGNIYVLSGTLTVNGGTIENGGTNACGGNIFSRGGSVIINGGNILNGKAGLDGGNIAVRDNTVSISGGTITGGDVAIIHDGVNSFTISGAPTIEHLALDVANSGVDTTITLGEGGVTGGSIAVSAAEGAFAAASESAAASAAFFSSVNDELQIAVTEEGQLALAAAHTHEWVEHAAVESTCDTEGNVAYKQCSGCGEAWTLGENPIPLSKDGWILGAKGHTWVEHAAVDPTCTTDGNIAYLQCSVCGAAQTAGENPIPLSKDGWILGAKGHTWDDATYEAPKTCSVCGATEGEALIAAAAIGENKFGTLNAAIEAANAGETITLLQNITLTEGLVIAADKEITLDLNGKTISLEDASGKASALITNKGNLTIDDSIGGGKLSFITTTPGDTSYASNTISNNGVLTIKAGTIENLSDGPACYALDNYAGSTATIEGGKLYAEKTCVRIFNWSATNATLNVIGGEIVANIGYGINVNMGNTPDVTLNISGGSVSTIANSYNLAVYVIVNTGNDAYTAENVKVNITGGTFGGAVALNGRTSSTMAPGNVSISGGVMDEVICYADPAYGFVSGGTFGSAVAAEYLANGFDCVENENGSYGVAPHIHTWVDVAAVEATCNAEGNIAYQYCSVCGAAQTAGENPMPLAKFGWILGPTGEHTFEHHDAVAATCDTDGHEAFDYCTTCECFFYADPLKLTYQAGIILALGHTWVEHEEVKPTCDAQGNIAYAQCSVCGAAQTLGEEPIPLSKDGWILAATGEHTYENGICTECGAEDPNYVPPVEDKEITFELGANGSASHNDGTEFTTKTFTEGDYTLKLTGGTKAYAGARDAKGNSCIKLGTGKLIGKFSFEVPEDVSEVVIYAAKYKTNGSKLKINGTTYTLSGASNNGAYDEIVIDTSETKTVTVETVSGALRAMINTIVFRVKAPAAPDNSSKLTTNIGGITFIVGQAQEFEFTTIANENAGVMVIGTSNFSDASAIEKLEYYETANGQWYELSGDFGPATGFPMSDATSKFRVTFAKAGKYTFTAEMKNAETGEVLCSVEATANVNDPDGKELTIAEAIAKGKAMAHNEYTETKYTVTGVITEVYNTQYGNMKLTDENGNILTIYGTYSADGKLSYSAMSVKPVAGDTVTIYGVIGQYNGTAQIKNGWIIEHIIPEPEETEHVHDWVEYEAVEPTCELPGNIAYKQCSECGEAWTLGENPMPLSKDGWILGVKHTIIHVEAKAATLEAEGNVEYWYCEDCGYAWLDEGLTLVTNLMSVILPKLEPEVTDPTEPSVPEETEPASSATYIFADYKTDELGGSACFRELDETVRVDISAGWFTTEARIYKNANLVISSKVAMESIVLNVGYKNSTFNVYVSEDGETWTEYQMGVTYTTAYSDISIELPVDCKYVKIDAPNAQVRIKTMSVDFAAQGSEPTEPTEPEHVHTWVEHEAVEPTCDTEGNIAYKQCSECGEAWTLGENPMPLSMYGWILGATGHDWVEHEAVEPSCNAEGNIAYKQCSNCGEAWSLGEEPMPLSKDGWILGPTGKHTFEHHDAIPATCDTDGHEAFDYCTTCQCFFYADPLKLTYQAGIILALGHTWIDVAAVEPTCDTEGNIAYQYCEVCGAAQTAGENPMPLSKFGWILGAKGHTWVEHEAVEPTCYLPGNIAYAQCSVCGAAQTAGENPMPLSKDGWILGVKHNIIHVEAKAATVKAEGNVEYWYCEDCGYAWLDEGLTLVTNLMSVILPKLEPVYGDLNADQEVNNDDVLALLWSNLFPEDFAIEGEADFNGDTIVDNNDVLKLLWFTLFPENYPL